MIASISIICSNKKLIIYKNNIFGENNAVLFLTSRLNNGGLLHYV